MSYRSFYKRVLGEKIIDVSSDGKNKKTSYRKNEEGEYERELSVDKIHNLDNTLLIIDEAHNISGNTSIGNSYGEAVKEMVKKSSKF
jgi:hypothetical protein